MVQARAMADAMYLIDTKCCDEDRRVVSYFNCGTCIQELLVTKIPYSQKYTVYGRYIQELIVAKYSQ